MKGKKGQIGQIITSFPSLIIIFIIMALFYFVSGAMSIKSEFKQFSYSDERLDSRVLMDLFLSDKVNTELLGLDVPELSPDGLALPNEMSIEELLKNNWNENEKGKVMKFIQARFDKIYSCGKKNKLSVFVFNKVFDKKIIVINYPENTNADIPLAETESSTIEADSFCEGNNGSKLGVSKVIADDTAFRTCIFVEGRLPC